MAATRTLTAVDPATGARITRRTARTYVGVIVTGDPAQGKAYPQSWAGRPDLAAKQLAKWGPDSYARLAPVVSDPWATPEPAAQAEPTPAPLTEAQEDLALALAEPAQAEPAPVALEPVALQRLQVRHGGVGPWVTVGQGLETLAAAQARAAQAAARHPHNTYRAVTVPTPEPAQAATRPTLPGEPAPLAPAPAPHGAAAPELPALPRVAPPAGAGVAAHRAAAAAGRPVSLAALAHDMGRSLGLAQGGRLPSRAQAPARLAPTGEGLAGQPWDPGTPEARAQVALQGERVGILWPIAQALRGEGVALPPSWATDGPVMGGGLTLSDALARLPLGAIAQAAAALAALPPVTAAQDAALALCRTGAVPGRPYL